MPFIQVNDIEMYYKVVVNNEETEQVDTSLPTLIVLHGGLGALDHKVEVEAWSPFSSHLQVIFLDQRGCGLSGGRDAEFWSMEEFGDDVFDFSNALEIEHPIVGGVSSGGYVAIAYATRHPEHPSALILANTEAKVSAEAKRDTFASLDREGAAEAAAASYAYDINPDAPGNAEAFMEHCVPLLSNKLFVFIEPEGGVNLKMKKQFANGYEKFDFLDDLPNIKCPVLWLAGRWDPLHPASCAEQSAERLDNVTLVILETGDPVYLDNDIEFQVQVTEFLEEKLSLVPTSTCSSPS